MNSLPSRVAGRKGDKPPKKKAISRRACLPDDQRCLFNPSSSASCPDTQWCGEWNAPGPSSSCSLYDKSSPWMIPPMEWPNNSFSPWYQYSQTVCPSATYVNNSYSSCLTPITSSPFVIKFLNARIKVCAGCKGPHPKDKDGNVLPPPHDLCLQHEEAIHFVNPKTGKEASKNGK